MNFRYFIFLCLILCIRLTVAAPLDSGRVVSFLRYKGISSTDVLVHLPDTKDLRSKVGRKVSMKRINEDLDTLYLTGYFESIVPETRVSRNRLELIFNCKLNPIIEEVEVLNNKDLSSRKIKSLIKSKKDNRLNIVELQKDKNRLETYFHKKGYDFFKVDSIVLNEKNILQVKVSEGEIDTIYFEGAPDVKRFVLYRNLDQIKGRAFNSITLRRDRARLLGLVYFFDVSSPELEMLGAPPRVSILFKLSEKKANRLDTGFEQEEARFVGFFKVLRNHNLIYSDILSAKTQFGDSDLSKEIALSSYSFRYKQPWLFNRYKTSFTADLWQDLKEEISASDSGLRAADTQSTTRIGGGLSLGYPLWRERLGVYGKYKREHVQPRDSSNFQSYNIESLATELRYRTVESLHNPKKGSYFTAEYENGGTIKYLPLHGLSFNRTTLRAATFVGINAKSVIGAHASFGYFSSEEESDSFELETFVVGGANSIRGYDESTFPFYGRKKVVYNLEYRYDFQPKVQAVFFMDFGRAFDTAWTFRGDLKVGKGIGLRFFTPVGPIRLDFAQGESDFYIHFGLGQLF
jgi:outer membrane protein insertion porin family